MRTMECARWNLYDGIRTIESVWRNPHDGAVENSQDEIRVMQVAQCDPTMQSHNAIPFCTVQPQSTIRITRSYCLMASLVCKKSGIFYEKNSAVKIVSRHGGGTTIIDNVAERRLVIICNLYRQETRCSPESTWRKALYFGDWEN